MFRLILFLDDASIPSTLCSSQEWVIGDEIPQIWVWVFRRPPE